MSERHFFVGRFAEIDALCGLGGVVATGRAAAAVVAAEPGLGKTRLLAEVVPTGRRPDGCDQRRKEVEAAMWAS
jgi:predicted ATPase